MRAGPYDSISQRSFVTILQYKNWVSPHQREIIGYIPIVDEHIKCDNYFVHVYRRSMELAADAMLADAKFVVQNPCLVAGPDQSKHHKRLKALIK